MKNKNTLLAVALLAAACGGADFESDLYQSDAGEEAATSDAGDGGAEEDASPDAPPPDPCEACEHVDPYWCDYQGYSCDADCWLCPRECDQPVTTATCGKVYDVTDDTAWCCP